MTIEGLNKAIKSCTIPRVLFFCGEETFLLENKVKAIKKKIIPSDIESFNFQYIDENKITVDDIIEASEIFPQVSDRRMVVIRNSGLFANLSLTAFKQIKEYIIDLPEYVCLVFWEDNFDIKKIKSLKFIEDTGGGVINFEYLPINKLEVWAERQFEKCGKRIIAKDLSYLIRVSGNSMSALDMNCRKLILFLGDNRHKITREDIDNIVQKSIEGGVYDIFNRNIIGGRGDKAKKQLKLLKNENASPTMIMSIILDQIYELLLCKLLKQDGMTAHEMIDYYDRKPPMFAVNKALENESRFSEKYLKKMIDKGLKYSIDMKTGKLDQWTATELFVSELIKRD